MANNDPGVSNIPLPILEFKNTSFIEKDSVEVKFGDLFGSEKINVNFQTIDIVPSARHLANLFDVDVSNLIDEQILVYDRISRKWKNVNFQQVIKDKTVYEETPTQLDAYTFQTNYNYISDSLKVFFNGLEEVYITKIYPNKFSFEVAILSDDIIRVDYLKA